MIIICGQILFIIDFSSTITHVGILYLVGSGTFYKQLVYAL